MKNTTLVISLLMMLTPGYHRAALETEDFLDILMRFQQNLST